MHMQIQTRMMKTKTRRSDYPLGHPRRDLIDASYLPYALQSAIRVHADLFVLTAWGPNKMTDIVLMHPNK